MDTTAGLTAAREIKILVERGGGAGLTMCVWLIVVDSLRYRK